MIGMTIELNWIGFDENSVRLNILQDLKANESCGRVSVIDIDTNFISFSDFFMFCPILDLKSDIEPKDDMEEEH
jgi:hypothetical protein